MPVSKAYENPLLGHARMRAMYRSLVEVRALGEQAGKRPALPGNLEACWVSTSLGLQPGDLTAGPLTEAYSGYVRAAGTRKADRAATAAEFKRAAQHIATVKAFPGTAADDLCCAIGRASALQAGGGGQVVVACVYAAKVTPDEWRRLLSVANASPLPLVIAAIPDKAIPDKAAPVDLWAVARKVPGPSIPVIAVDAGDAVALYRVMQESCVRARADGGVVVIECVRTGTDPVRLLATQLRNKGICTDRWLAAVEGKVHALTQEL